MVLRWRMNATEAIDDWIKRQVGTNYYIRSSDES